MLTINADGITAVDGGGIPTGEIMPVANTPFDFRTAMPIGTGSLQPSADGQWSRLRPQLRRQPLGRLRHDPRPVVDEPTTGRMMTMSSDQPGMQFYTGNFLDGTTYGADRPSIPPGGWPLPQDAALPGLYRTTGLPLDRPQSGRDVQIHHRPQVLDGRILITGNSSRAAAAALVASKGWRFSKISTLPSSQDQRRPWLWR